MDLRPTCPVGVHSAQGVVIDVFKQPALLPEEEQINSHKKCKWDYAHTKDQHYILHQRNWNQIYQTATEAISKRLA
jgi:hypothetical protein